LIAQPWILLPLHIEVSEVYLDGKSVSVVFVEAELLAADNNEAWRVIWELVAKCHGICDVSARSRHSASRRRRA